MSSADPLRNREFFSKARRPWGAEKRILIFKFLPRAENLNRKARRKGKKDATYLGGGERGGYQKGRGRRRRG